MGLASRGEGNLDTALTDSTGFFAPAKDGSILAAFFFRFRRELAAKLEFSDEV
jgi:hypothetical protein